MPLTSKGNEIMRAMEKQYGKEKGKQVFYASANKGTITGVHDGGLGPSIGHNHPVTGLPPNQVLDALADAVRKYNAAHAKSDARSVTVRHAAHVTTR